MTSKDLRDHRQQTTHVQNRRNVQVGSRNNQSKPRTGTDGFLCHTRLGLVGWISYWCLGDSALTVDTLVTLTNTLGLTELVSDALTSRKQKQAETNTKIVDLLVFASRRLAFYDIFHTQGIEEALKFAFHDEAETVRQKAGELAQNAQSTAAAAGSVANGASIQGETVTAVLAAEREVRVPVAHQERRSRCEVSEEEFERRQAWVKGAMEKSKVTVDIMHGKERTSTGQITSARDSES